MPITPAKLRACQASATRKVSWAPVMVQDCPMLADAMEIADSCARSDIECNVMQAFQTPDLRRWYDSSTADPEDREAIDQALRYLEARGILVRDSTKPHVVTFKEPK